MKKQIFNFAKNAGCEQVKMGIVGVWVVTNNIAKISEAFPQASVSHVKNNTYTVTP